ncbi:unnamed protein product [Cylicostephanus goldi]|uniref:Peptidase S1 domain-containing protein n=1 Tax=Cylicostephanus goldi TaxID=71465 RepID=A0A3P6QRR9_CYLGO|nr:unnamed protein product [Cylicostephanus goldi]
MEPFCTGVLITQRYILTSAHCVCYNSSKYPQGVQPIIAKERVGVIFESARIVPKVSSIKVYPSYNPRAPHPPCCDIALIELNEMVNVTAVTPARARTVILGPERIQSIGYGNGSKQFVQMSNGPSAITANYTLAYLDYNIDKVYNILKRRGDLGKQEAKENA